MERKSSDPIQILNVTQTPSGWERMIAAATKSIVCVVVVLAGSWLLAHHIEIPAPAWGIATLVIIGTFDLKSLAKNILPGNGIR